MLYEILQTLFTEEIDHFGLFVLFIFILYGLHAFAYFVSWCASWCYSYIQDGEAKIDNWYFRFIENRTVKKSTTGQDVSLNGWFEVNKHYAYIKLNKGVVVDTSDEDYGRSVMREKNHNLKATKYVSYRAAFNTKGEQIVIDNYEIDESLFTWVSFGGPAMLGITIAIADWQPAIVICAVLTYVILRASRKIVRVSKKLTSHLADKNAHNKS
jgi:hypothetical protein